QRGQWMRSAFAVVPPGPPRQPSMRVSRTEGKHLCSPTVIASPPAPGAGLWLPFVHPTPELALHAHAARRTLLEGQSAQTELVVLPQRVEPGPERGLESARGRVDVTVLELQPQLAHVLVLLVANRDLPVARYLGDLVHEGLEDRRIHALAS